MSEQKLLSLDLKDLFIHSNDKLGDLRDDLNQHIDDISNWINCIYHQTKQESRNKKNYCEICTFTSSNSGSFELHHVAGRKHDFRMITACKKCHRILSDNQKLRDHRWEMTNQPENTRKAFFLHGIYDILRLKSRKTGDSIYEEYASKLVERIHVLLKEEFQ